MSEGRRLVQEQVLHDQEVERLERVRDVVGVGVGLRDVLTLHVEALEGATGSFVEHVGNAQAGLGIELDLPLLLEQFARRLVGDVAVAGVLVRERAHVAGALHVVLAAQRVHADALVAEVAGRHGEVGHGHDRGRALTVLGDAEAVVDRGVAAGGEQPGGGADVGGRHAADGFQRLGRVALLTDELLPLGEVLGLAARLDEAAVDQVLGHDHVAHRVEHGDVGRWHQLQVIVGLDVRALDEVGAARIDDDQLGALAQALLHARAEHGMGVGRVGADDHDHVGLVDALEVLRAGRLAERLLQAVAGWRVADAGAGVDVVVAERGAHHALHDVDFLVGRARGGDAADGAAAILLLHGLEAVGRVLDRLVPGHLAPGIGDLLADHRVRAPGPCASRNRRRSGP